MYLGSKKRKFFKSDKESSNSNRGKAKSSFRNRVKKYLASSCGCEENELSEDTPLNKLTTPYNNEPTAYYQIIYWLETRYNKTKAPVSTQFIEEKTVGDLLDYLCK